MNSIDASIAGLGAEDRLARIALEFVGTVKRMYSEAQRRDFTVSDWAPLVALIAVDEFVWAGPFCETMGWVKHGEFLIQWARTMHWEPTINRVHQWRRTVFIECSDHCVAGDREETVHKVAVFEFNSADKIIRISSYLRREQTLGL